MFFLRSLPRLVVEQHKDWDDFQTTNQHIEHKDDFGEDVVACKVAARADLADARSYVVQARDDGGEVGGDAFRTRVWREYRKKHGGEDHDENVDDEEVLNLFNG